jgi:ABC-type multidrug transport system ATPase subunit
LSKVNSNIEVEMLCDKIAILKDGKIKISCKVNRLLNIVGGYIIKIMLKKLPKNMKKVFKKKKRNYKSFNKSSSGIRFKSDSLRQKGTYQFSESRLNDEKLQEQLMKEKSLEQALSIFTKLKQKKNIANVKSHLIIMNRGKYLVNTEDLINLIGKM